MDAPVNVGIDYLSEAIAYANRVIERERIAGELEILACRRFLEDIRKSKSKRFQWELNPIYCNDICDFVSKCKHTTGDQAGEELGPPLDYWCFILVNAFGWRRKGSNERRFHLFYIEITRKAAKSTILAAIALYLQNCDGVGSPTVIIGASVERQADHVFKPARQMIETDPELRDEFSLTTTKTQITSAQADGGVGVITKIQGKGATEDGHNVLAAILDEFHAHKDKQLYQVIRSGMGVIKNWMLWMITTAGVNAQGVCWDRRNEAIKILRNEIQLDHMFAVIYTLDDEDDPYDPIALEKANPQVPAIISRAALKMFSSEARQGNSAEYLRTRCNLWGRGTSVYFPITRYDLCLAPDDFDWKRSGRAFVGVDLATQTDIAGYGVMLDTGDGIAIRHRYFAPGDYRGSVDESLWSNYERWIADGWLTVSDNNRVDIQAIEEALREDISDLELEMIAFDTWQGAQMMNRLDKDGIPVIGYPKNTKNFSAPTRNIREMIETKRLYHEGNPITRWMFANVHCGTDANGNVFPRKASADHNSSEKIDGAIMSIMANGLRLNDLLAEDEEETVVHPYANIGLRSLGGD